MKDLEVPPPEFNPMAVKNMEIRVGTSGGVTGAQRGGTSQPETRPMTEGNPMITVFNQAIGSDKQSLVNSQHQ
jgi:hypothetical protein